MDHSVTFTFDDAGHQRQFRSYDAFISWLDAERNSWEWLANHSHGNIHSNISTQFNSLRQNAIDNRDGGQDLEAIVPIVTSNYSPDGWLRHSEGIFGKRIAHIRSTKGDNAAAFTYAFAKQAIAFAQANTPEQIAGCMMFSMPELDKPEEIARRLELERKSYRAAISRGIDKLELESEQRNSDYGKHLHTARRLAIRQLLRTRDLDKKFRTFIASQSMETIASIKAVENTFREQMGLQAPVEYWTEKAKAHRENARAGVRRLQWFFPVSGVTFLAAFGGASWLLLNGDNVNQTVYVIVAAGLGSLAALIFWVGRLLTKLYLSQHHLHHDAEERAVMTTTYLALTHESAASEEDKKIILAALFRPTVDGLIKDDGPSDLSTATLLSKLGMSR